MQLNVYPETGRLRFRDPILRDEELRCAATRVAKKICTVNDVDFNPRTSSVLVCYDKETLDENRLKALVPLAMKLNAKVKFYDESKKGEVLALIEAIEKKVESIGVA